MSYQEIWFVTSRREHLACRIMCMMKVNENGKWAVCLRNKILSRIASIVLGDNAFDLVIRIGEALECVSPEKLDELKKEMAALKVQLG